MRLFLLLLSASAVLGFVIYSDVRSGPYDAGPVSAAPATKTTAPESAQLQVPDIAPVDRAHFAGISERPLFYPSRRPQEEVRSVRVRFTGLQLKGVTITPAGRSALLLKPGEEGYVIVQEGQAVDGWTVKTIKHDRIVLSAGGSEQVIEFNMEIEPAAKTPSPRKGRQRSSRP